MLSLRTVDGISRREVEYGYRRAFAPLETLFQTYAAHGLAETTADGWRLTPRGFLVSNQIIGALLEALGREEARRLEKDARRDYRVSSDGKEILL